MFRVAGNQGLRLRVAEPQGLGFVWRFMVLISQVELYLKGLGFRV